MYNYKTGKTAEKLAISRAVSLKGKNKLLTYLNKERSHKCSMSER